MEMTKSAYRKHIERDVADAISVLETEAWGHAPGTAGTAIVSATMKGFLAGMVYGEACIIDGKPIEGSANLRSMLLDIAELTADILIAAKEAMADES